MFGEQTGVAIKAYVEAALAATERSRPTPVLSRLRAPRGSEPPSTLHAHARIATDEDDETDETDEDTGVYLRPFHH